MSDRAEGAGSRLATWLLGSVAGGWAVVYNVMRLSGSSPREASWISLAIGAVLGLAAFGGAVALVRRLAASGRMPHRGALEVPPAERLSGDQRNAMRLAAAALAVLAGGALLLGFALAGDYLAADDGRSATTLLLAVWNVLAGAWFADEAGRLRRGDAQGIESVVLGCMLTAVLAGVGLSRSMIEPGQVVLIVLAGVGGAATAFAAWRLAGARGVPTTAVVAVAVAAASLVLPLVA